MKSRDVQTENAKAILLEEALNSMPYKELPPYVEQRILASIREHADRKNRIVHKPLSRLQWAMLSMGSIIVFYSSVSFTNLAVSQTTENYDSISGIYEVSDSGILELYKD